MMGSVEVFLKKCLKKFPKKSLALPIPKDIFEEIPQEMLEGIPGGIIVSIPKSMLWRIFEVIPGASSDLNIWGIVVEILEVPARWIVSNFPEVIHAEVLQGIHGKKYLMKLLEKFVKGFVKQNGEDYIELWHFFFLMFGLHKMPSKSTAVNGNTTAFEF